jgi:hypothetical protein
MPTETGVDTAPIEADIKRSRADLAVALEALADRIAPKKLIARAKTQLSAKAADMKERLNPARVVQRKLGRSPEPALGPAKSPAITVRAGSGAEDRPALEQTTST